MTAALSFMPQPDAATGTPPEGCTARCWRGKEHPERCTCRCSGVFHGKDLPPAEREAIRSSPPKPYQPRGPRPARPPEATDFTPQLVLFAAPPKNGEAAKCCEAGQLHLEWHTESFEGRDRAGYYVTDLAGRAFVRVRFCPFCGVRS